MSSVNRAAIILAELAKCTAAHYSENAVLSVYLTAESIGTIVGQALAMQDEIDRMKVAAYEAYVDKALGGAT